MALTCLGSLLRHAADPLELRIHDDGTLTAGDRERLTARLARPASQAPLARLAPQRPPEIIARAEADELVAPLLVRYPAARAFRAANSLGLKLLDVPLLCGGDDELAYCDSDVLFLRPFSGLFDLPPGFDALFMRDPQNAYSVRSWHLFAEPRLRLAAHVNSGVIAFRTRFFDPGLLDWFLSRPQYRFAPVWVEQTCWALLAQPAGCRLLDPGAVSIPVAGKRLAERQVALHFVNPVRELFEHYTRATGGATLAERPSGGAPPPVPRQPVVIRSFPARRLRAHVLAATEFRRRLSRLRRGVG